MENISLFSNTIQPRKYNSNLHVYGKVDKNMFSTT